MADAAKGAGMVFFCNPNIPAGTAHNAAAVERFVRRVKQTSPDTRILIDEAYIDYAHGPGTIVRSPPSSRPITSLLSPSAFTTTKVPASAVRAGGLRPPGYLRRAAIIRT
jgi:bifunctional pyridoxal-dependent enzyme with beta-cystathionase and maltose regulon repressor activities